MKKNQYNNKYLPLFAIYENVGTKNPLSTANTEGICVCVHIVQLILF